ncbi:putative [histone H3]-lysine(4) N-trimethyltransferase chromatin regulator PHD family [Helianthus annuus]|nr:putative [histone H3]-lysine(4) N-trimethyltransferase chromatin regulator PHD family [Helianthus annuus]
MAFHVACPITCRKICYCSLGFPHDLQNDDRKNGFLDEIARLKAFLEDPWLIKGEKKTVQVVVPKVTVVVPPVRPRLSVDPAVLDGSEAEEMLSARSKRAAVQKQAAAALLVAEDYARRFESGETVNSNANDVGGEEQVVSNAKIMCRLCFSGENERSEKARKMLSCKSCTKKYHRSCLKAWAHDRDLFHWSSWTCPSCRVCEVCRRTGDPSKLMFCKRCDGAYHCYCQHPPHKNVSRGPYLCPKHTSCHSCASTVPGNGSSLRWFLGYTCCDACGRLFVKGNYCPVCLKVYRDSESTPMVCCDICQRWVHCHCDGISDEKYLQFQVNNHLQYRCASCRGECYQVRDLEDAVQELWRRRDKADQDLIASLRAAAGLPTQEEIFAITPYSDDEDDGPPLKKEYGHSIKFSLKGLVDKSPKKNKDHIKKSANKKYTREKGFRAPTFGRIEHSDAQSIGSITGDNKDEDVQSRRYEEASLTDGVWPVDQPEAKKLKLVNVVPVKTDHRSSRHKMKNHGPNQLDDTGFKSNKTKLVIHLGGRNKNVVNSPSKSLPDQVLTTSNSEKASMGDGPPRGPQKELKPLLKLKFKNPYGDDRSSWASPGEDDKSCVKGQRSKRKRPPAPSPPPPASMKEDKDTIMDAKWIIQKLGKHAIGKIVEVHQPSNNSWHKGTVTEVSEDTSSASVTLDDGKAMNVDLGKQGIRFVSQKQR